MEDGGGEEGHTWEGGRGKAVAAPSSASRGALLSRLQNSPTIFYVVYAWLGEQELKYGGRHSQSGILLDKLSKRT